MSLSDVIAAVGAVLEPLGADQVLTEPPSKLPDDRCFVVYPEPGEVTIAAHSGRNSGAVYQADDDVLIDFHIKAARDAMLEIEPQARAMLIATRDALIAALKNGALNGTVIGCSGISTRVYGAMDFWFPDQTCGFELALHIRHMTEAAV